jgi:hypothetical protein
MIQMPRRSVTRFFIPLIDVLTLLFCIFLLIPLVEGSPGAEEGSSIASVEEMERLRKEVAQLRREAGEKPEELRKELENLRQEKMEILQERLAVRVLEIDPNTGRLYYNDPERAEIQTEADARALIGRDRKVQIGARELYYLILYPRQPTSPYPHREQREQYERWFKEVPHAWDIPGLPPGSKGKP